MRSTLHIKFIALYIIFGFLCLFSTATLTAVSYTHLTLPTNREV